jgi:hypothetical protein
MRLTEFLARYPRTRLAGPADNARLLGFVERAPMRTSGFDVGYSRSPDFFRLLEHQGERAHVVVGEGDDGSLRGLGTLSLRPGWMGGRPTTVGYLGDLRIEGDRELRVLWRQVLAGLLTHAGEIEELTDCRHWLTVILDDNRQARRALSGRRPGSPQLVPVAPFAMRNLLARLPLPRARRGQGRFDVFPATAACAGELVAFFDAENRELPYGFREGLRSRLVRWHGLRLEDFVCAADAEGLVACVAPWSPAPVKQTLVSRVPARLRWLGGLAAALPGQPLRVPREGEAMRAPCLTHLTFAARLGDPERVAVFRALLDRVLEARRGEDRHCLSLCDFRAWRLGRGLRDFVQQTVPITVYAVLPPGAPAAPAEALGSGRVPAFEMAMV